jgi:hypothetical protein
MAIMISSAGPERVFFGAKHTLAPERIRFKLGAEMTECLKSRLSWVRIIPGRQRAHVMDGDLSIMISYTVAPRL